MAFGGQVFKNIGAGLPCAGLGLFAAFKAHLVKQDFAELLGTAKIKLVSRELIGFGFIAGHGLVEVGREARQVIAIHLDTMFASMLRSEHAPAGAPAFRRRS